MHWDKDLKPVAFCCENNEEAKQFHEWIHNGGPNKQQIEKAKMDKIRKEIAEECREDIEENIKAFSDYLRMPSNISVKDFSYDEKLLTECIMKIIRGE